MGLDGARVNTLRELTLYLLFGLHSNFHLKDGDPTSSACCYLWSIHMFIPGAPRGASTIFSLLTPHSSLSPAVDGRFLSTSTQNRTTVPLPVQFFYKKSAQISTVTLLLYPLI